MVCVCVCVCVCVYHYNVYLQMLFYKFLRQTPLQIIFLLVNYFIDSIIQS